MAEVFFFIAAIGALGGAVGVIWNWNPFYNVLALVVHLISIAALFLLLRAEFLAAAQVVVYAGAVMVLYVFVVAYIGGAEPAEISPFGPKLRPVAILFVGAILVELVIAFAGSGLKALDGEGAGYQPGFGSPGYIGDLLLTKFLVAFELASLLLTIAAIGAVVLARRRRGTVDEAAGDEQVLSVMDALRLPPGTGSQKEAVSGLPDVHEPAPGSRPEITTGTSAGTDREGGW
jgi:NADH:ubiquinone oxidoreductase subunit 6 (subunit J)